MPDESVTSRVPSVTCSWIDKTNGGHVTVSSLKEPAVSLSSVNPTHTFTVPDPTGSEPKVPANSCPKEHGQTIFSLTRPMRADFGLSEENARSGSQFTLLTRRGESVTLLRPGEYHCFYVDYDPNQKE
jgi:hypothetical protein